MTRFLKFNREKVDLTKYIEQHSFHFDGAYGENSKNTTVCQAEFLLNFVDLHGYNQTSGQLSL